MKKVYLALIVFGMLFVVGCRNDGPSSSKTESKATEKLMAEMHAQVGMPNITNFQEKKWAKMIFELRDKSDLITYAYLVDMNGNRGRRPQNSALDAKDIWKKESMGHGYTAEQVKELMIKN